MANKNMLCTKLNSQFLTLNFQLLREKIFFLSRIRIESAELRVENVSRLGLFPLLALSLCLQFFVSCSASKAAQQKQPSPVTVENAKPESALATVKLTPEAEKRLAIQTVTMATGDVARTMELSGEIVMPQGQTMIVSAPMAGTLQAATKSSLVVGTPVNKGQALFRVTPYLAPERDLRVQINREISSLTERVAAAKQRKQRAEILANEKAGSVRAVEEAQAELSIAEAELKGAQARLEQFGNGGLAADVSVTITAPMSGVVQKVHTNANVQIAGGTPLIEIVNLATMWVRVPVYVGDLPNVSRNQSVRIHGLGESGTTFIARPVNAPPTADANAATADLYYALPNKNQSLRPGQRVGVTLGTLGFSSGLVIPWSAVLHDIQGATWVYENTAAQTFVRRPVEVRSVANNQAVLARAPAAGAKIVTVGAVELFGAEFGVGK